MLSPLMGKYDVAAYIWPSYHYEPRMEHFWPEKDGEWYTVRRAMPRWPGHRMPRKPLLGYQDEADPAVMRQHVELALAHGINIFIMDWYWYENAPCFERQLNEGLLPAIEGTDMRFCLMWANHNVTNLWNMHEDTDWKQVQMSGAVSRQELEPMFERILDKYFGHPNYYRLDQKPLFSIFDYPTLIQGLGGIPETVDAFSWMRQRCSDADLNGLHIQAIARTVGKGGPEGGVVIAKDKAYETAVALGFDSATSYQYCMAAGGLGEYQDWADKAVAHWDSYAEAYGRFYPHVSIGWDDTHRNPSQITAVTGANPEKFAIYLQKAKAYVDARPDQAPFITINSWNEWTEGSYLLPDEEFGYGYLEAVKRLSRNDFTRI